MSAHSHDDMVPRGALLAAGALVLVSLLLVIAVRLGIADPSPSAVSERAAPDQVE